MAETDRLILRPIVAGDLDAVHDIFSDPVAMRYSVSGTRTRAETEEWIASSRRRHDEAGYGFWAVVLRDESTYVGHAGLLRQEVDARNEVEIGYWFRRAYWGRGLATEAAAACRDHGFEVLHCDRLISIVDPRNAASCRVAEKVGMTLDGLTVWRDRKVRVYAIERAG